MTSTILLTGGTGTLGRLVLPRLRDAGVKVRVLSRRAQPPADGVEYVTGDLTTGAGIDDAVAGVDTIVHCAGTSKGDDRKAETLVRAAKRAGRPHIVFVSVVGADRIPMAGRVDRSAFGYYGSKNAAEKVIAGSGLPWTTLRATQFHDLLLMVLRPITKSPVVPVMGVRFQPVDAADVADRLVELALGEPAGLVPDLAGPRVYRFDELVRSYLKATGRRRLLMPVRVPGQAFRALRDGANLALDHADGQGTWEAFLASHS